MGGRAFQVEEGACIQMHIVKQEQKAQIGKRFSIVRRQQVHQSVKKQYQR